MGNKYWTIKTSGVTAVWRKVGDLCGLEWPRRGRIQEAGHGQQAGGDRPCWVRGVLKLLETSELPVMGKRYSLRRGLRIFVSARHPAVCSFPRTQMRGSRGLTRKTRRGKIWCRLWSLSLGVGAQGWGMGMCKWAGTWPCPADQGLSALVLWRRILPGDAGRGRGV